MTDATYPRTPEPLPSIEAVPRPQSAAGDVARLEAQLADVTRERDNLEAIVDILQEIGASLHFVDILQTISKKLGQAFGLDRCSVFLTGENNELRLVASYEDPSIRNLLVDLERYPELKRALTSGETVFVADASADPMFDSVRDSLEGRNVQSIIVVPIHWRQDVIGAIFVRTEKGATPFSDTDVRHCQVIADLAAKSLRNAHRFETLLRASSEQPQEQRRSELQRIALIAYMRRLMARFAANDDPKWSESLLPKASDEELERLVGVTLQVIGEEAKG